MAKVDKIKILVFTLITLILVAVIITVAVSLLLKSRPIKSLGQLANSKAGLTRDEIFVQATDDKDYYVLFIDPKDTRQEIKDLEPLIFSYLEAIKAHKESANALPLFVVDITKAKNSTVLANKQQAIGATKYQDLKIKADYVPCLLMLNPRGSAATVKSEFIDSVAIRQTLRAQLLSVSSK